MKFIDFEVKSLDPSGAIEGLASTYGNVDRVGDVVMPGAFVKSIRQNGGRVPLLWQHDQREPIGVAHLEDTTRGLVLKAQLDLDVEAGRRAYSALKKGIVSGLSIGYDTRKATMKNGVRQLIELQLFEVSVVTIPANASATVTGVKQDEPQGARQLRQFAADVSDLAARVGIEATVRQMRSLARDINAQ